MKRTTTRKLKLSVLTIVLALFSLALGTTRASAQLCNCRLQSYSYTFDKTVAPFQGVMYRDGQIVDLPGKQRPVLSLGGNSRNKYALLNTYGADAVWMLATFNATANNLFLNYDVVGIANAGRLAPIIYVGKKAPISVYQFEMLGYPLEKGRQTLYRQMDLAEAGFAGQDIVIAIGYINLDRVQAGQSALVDNLNIFINDGD